MRSILVSLFFALVASLHAVTLQPGEKYDVKLPSGKAAGGKRVILHFNARYDLPQRIGEEWHMTVMVNGKRLSAFLLPQGSGVLRLVNRKSATFHGTGKNYVKDGKWNVALNNSREEIEHIYCPADYEQLYYYSFDVTDALADEQNIAAIVNDAPRPDKNEKNPAIYVLQLTNVHHETVNVVELPDAVERSFEAVAAMPDCSIPQNSPPAEFKFALPSKDGYHRVIRFRSRLSYGGNGSNSNLQVRLNGEFLSREDRSQLHRMLNRGAYYMGGREAIIAQNGRLTIMHGPKWGPLPKQGDSAEARKINWYYIDIDDMLIDGENTVSFQSLTNPATFSEKRGFKNGHPFLYVCDIAVGYVPLECEALSPARYVPTRQLAESPNRFASPSYTCSIAPSGGLQIVAGKRTFFLESAYSYPKAGFNAFNCVGAAKQNAEAEFRGSVSGEKGTYNYDYAGKYYRIRRTVECVGNALHITDRISNLTDNDLGMKVSVNLIGDSSADIVRKHGSQFYDAQLSSHNYPNSNSTIFWGYRENPLGVGLVLVDDIFRLQAQYRASKMDGEAGTSHLGFTPKAERTLRYSVYILPSNDYFDMINAVRNDWKVNKTIPGMISWNGAHVSKRDEQFIKRYDALGSTLIIDGQKWFNATEYHAEPVDVVNEIQIQKEWKDRAVMLRPDAKVLLQFQMVFSWRNKDNCPDLMADSLIVNPDGSIPEYGRARPGASASSTYSSGEIGLYHAYHYPAIGNKYYQYIMDTAKAAMDANFGGVYFDTPNYTAVNYGRFTYDRWDGMTVDLNPDFTISRKYADLCLYSREARFNIFDYITKRGGIVVLNAPPLTEKIQRMNGPVIHFSEGDREERLTAMHLTTPVMLGQHGSNGKPAYGRRATWKTEEDYMDDMVWKVKNGILYAAYWPPRGVSELHEWPTRDMFPITITDIHAGWIRGKERIITVNDGKFGWDEKATKSRIRIYGKDGRMVGDELANADENGKFEIKLPENGMAIIIRQ